MKLADVLESYSDEALDRLAADKVDEVAGLRLPRSVLIQEISTSLSSMSYVARVLAPARPPTYALLKSLIDAPDHSAPAAGFREAVLGRVDALTSQAADPKTMPAGKNYTLYLRIVFAAWENDGQIDRSEALLLEALRKELGIWAREHLLLEHHPTVRGIWDTPRAFEGARNHLLSTGMVLSMGDTYVLPDEVCSQVRRVWDMELEDVSYRRLAQMLTGVQLRGALEAAALPLSGSKEERIERLVQGLVPPAAVLDGLTIDEIRDLCRACKLQVSAAKADLSASLLTHFDAGRDLAGTEVASPTTGTGSDPGPALEARTLETSALRAMLARLTVDQVQDVLAALKLRRGGTRTERVDRLVESAWSERQMLAVFPRIELAAMCRKLGLRVSGVKHELCDRLVAYAGRPDEEERATSVLDPQPDPVPVYLTFEQEPAREAEPPGMHDVQVDHPTLDSSEQLILALLKQARSLTENEIERAAHRHELGWFLTKAHMAELIARVTTDGVSPIRIRSSGGLNVYEWVGIPSATRGLGRDAARDVIDALRQGVVPERHLDALIVGQRAAREHLVDLLGHVKTGRSEFKFVRGAYGAGKTFLCAWLRERALAGGLATSTVRIGPDQPLSDLPIFYAGMVRGLRTPEKRDGSALADVLESWLLGIHRSAALHEGREPFAKGSRQALALAVQARIEEELGQLSGLDPSFASALRHFYTARLERDTERAGIALAWLQGSQALSADALRRVGVRGHLQANEVFPRMRALLRVIGAGRLGGLLLLVDELELVRKFPHARQREQAYETLRLLVDEAGENGLPGCLMVFTGTDGLFDDRRYGLASYEALYNRIALPAGVAGAVSVRQPVIELRSLDGGLLVAVGRRVRDIHAIAYGWPAAERVPETTLHALVARATAFGDGAVNRLPRPFLKEMVHILDLCEENPSILATDIVPVAAAPETFAASVADLLGS